MSIRKILSITTLACMLPIAGCEESEPTGEDEEQQQDQSGSSDEDDAEPDAGSARDGGKSSDGGTPDVGKTPTKGAASHFFLPTGEPDNTSAPTLEVDGAGNTHMVYPAYAGGDSYYAFCAAGTCADTKDVKLVKFETAGTVGNAMLALTKDGKPRVLLSSYQKVYYGTCDQGCTERANWQFGEILDHGSNRDISGEAFALDPQGRPRFVMHTYRALFGIGQKPPKTYYARCDANCATAASWRFDDELDSTHMFVGSTLRFDAQGTAHLATAVLDNEKGDTFAYYQCSSECENGDRWIGLGFGQKPYESNVEIATIHPTISLALTTTGTPRVLLLGKGEGDKKNIVFFECQQSCLDGKNWVGSIISDHDRVKSGLDLALDAQNRPRFVYTLDYNIVLAHCDAATCAAADSPWDLTMVERSSDLPPDQIFLWDNCTVGAWVAHDPSLALTASGEPRVGYQMRDISGGFSRPDTTKPRCTAGTDMTWSRMTQLSSYKQ